MIKLELVLGLLLGGVYAADDPGILTFVGAEATSTNAGTSVDEFSPRNAIDRGTSYWCSEGGLRADEQVIWKGWFREANDLKGVKIEWSHAPRDIKLVGSPDRLADKVLLDWRQTKSKEASYEETIMFLDPTTVTELKIYMRGIQHDFIGILQVTPIPAGLPIFMLLSGTTSADNEYCLQVADGSFVANERVVLDECAYALAAGDGRDLWQLTPTGQLMLSLTEPSLCLSLEDGSLMDGGKFVIEDCEEASKRSDGRGIFSFSPNGQIQSAIKPNMCLSLKGDELGFKNIINDNESFAEASDVSDVDHAASNALTESKKHYWASGAFDDTSQNHVNFNIDFGKETEFHRVEIDWEYPPLTYSIATSLNGVDFTTMQETLANPSNRTIDDIGFANARVLRIGMHRPHPILGVIESGIKKQYLYGIRTIKAFVYRMKLVLDGCAKASHSADSRDKWFRIPVHNVDSGLAQGVGSMESNFAKAAQSTAASSSAVLDSLIEMETCKDEIDDIRVRMEDSMDSIHASLRTRMDRLLERTIKLSSTNPILGLTIDFPARSCREIRERQAKQKNDGFYAVLSQCNPDVLRLYCDMDSTVGYYFYNETEINSEARGLLDLERFCANLGLESMRMSTVKQLNGIRTMLKMMGTPEVFPQVIPLAFDFRCETGVCAKSFYDLGSMNDVTGILSRFLSGETMAISGLTQDAMGLTSLESNGVSIFDWKKNELLGVICSSLGMDSTYMFTALLDCDTTLTSSRIFQGPANTNFRVSCPPECQYAKCEIYGGKDFVYSGRSSVCRAALHAGIDYREFNVALEAAHIEYPSIIQNGITSLAYKGPGRYAFRVSSVPKQCPALAVAASLPARVNMSPRAPIGPVTGKSGEDNFDSGLKKGQKHLALEQLSMGRGFPSPNEETEELARHTRALSETLTKMDRHAVLLTRQSIIKSLVAGRGKIKPLEETVKILSEKSLAEYPKISRLARKIELLAGEKFSTLMGLETRQAQLEKKRSWAEGFASWSLREELQGSKKKGLPDLFFLYELNKQAEFLFANELGGRRYELSQILIETRHYSHGTTFTAMDGEFYDGASLIVKNRNFYDFSFFVSLYAQKAEDQLGILFRVKDQINFQLALVQFESSEFNIRILRVQNGLVAGTSTAVSSAYGKAGVWTDILIECRMGQIRVAVGDHLTQNYHTLIHFIDETHMSGSIGIATFTVTGKVGFDNPSVESQCCDHKGVAPQHHLVPLPPKCVSFQDRYRTHFHSLFEVFTQSLSSAQIPKPRAVYRHGALVSPPALEELASPWRYQNLIGGRLISMFLEEAQAELVPAEVSLVHLAILKPRYRGFCVSGKVQFDFLVTGCDNPSIGAIYRFRDSNNYRWATVGSETARIRQRSRGGPFVLIAERLGGEQLAENMWQSFELEFGPRHTAISYAGSPAKELQPVIALDESSIEAFDDIDATSSHYVGIGVQGCRRVAIDRLSISPSHSSSGREKSSTTSFRELKQALLAAPERLFDYSHCTSASDPVHRQRMCVDLFPPENGYRVSLALSRCLGDFCNKCCESVSSLLVLRGSNTSIEECITECSMPHK